MRTKKIAIASILVGLVMLLGTMPAAALQEPGVAGRQESLPAASMPVSAKQEEDALQSQEYTLTVHFKAQGEEEPLILAQDYSARLREGQEYLVPAPELEGWAPLQPCLEGKMPGGDVELTLYYSKTREPEVESGAVPNPALRITAPVPFAEAGSYQLVVHYFYLDDGTEIGGTIAAQPFYGNYITGEGYSVPSPVVVGYTPDTPTVAGTMGTNNLVLNVWYIKAGQTAYTVQHLFEELDGSFAGNPNYPTQTLHGATGSQTQAQPHFVPGFTIGTVTQAAIAADGSTQIVIQYSRSRNYLYFNNDGKAYIDPIELKYEQATSLPANPVAAGYTFVGWYLNPELTKAYTQSSITMGTADITLYAKWERQQVAYRVATWIEDANNPGHYLYANIMSPAWATGVVGDMTQVTESYAPEQYTFVRADNVAIQADGSTIVNVYYDRNSYTINFYRGLQYDVWNPTVWVQSIETTPFKSITAKFGADISEQWNQLGDEFFSYRWLVTKNQWGSWITGMHTQQGSNQDFYGVRPTGNHTYYMHYYFELLDQTSADFDYQDTSGIKYKDNTALTEVFPYPDHSVSILAPSSNAYPGFYQPQTNFCRQFDQNSAVTVHHGGYLYRRRTTQIDFSMLGGAPLANTIQALYETNIENQIPANPSKTGYEFGGWYNNESFEGEPFAFITAPSRNTILYAKWVKKLFTVDFNLNYADAANTIPAQSIGYGGTVEQPQPPTRPGYAFVGWYTNPEGTGNRYVFDKPVENAFTLYAVWTNEDVGYTVKYTKQNDGQPFAPLKEVVGKAGVTVTETAYTDNAQKYVPDAASKSLFLGANSASNVLEFMYIPFTTLSYKVEYRYAADNTLIPQNILGSENPKIVENSEFARVVEQYLPVTGYLPDSYQKAKTLAYEVTAADIQQNVLVFYYSPAAGKGYTVEHYLENPSATGPADKYFAAPQVSQNLSAPLGNTVTALPQQFLGYRYNAAQSAATATGQVVTSPALVLRLYYDLERYTVTFDSQGGSIVHPLTNVAYGSVLQSQKPESPTFGNHQFLEWYKEAECVHEWNFASDLVKGDTTLFARWGMRYSVLYQAGGGTGSQQDDTLYNKGDSVQVKDPGSMAREGYTFNGWQTEEKVYQPGEQFSITKDMVLTAVWKEKAVPPSSGSSSAPSSSVPSSTPPASSSGYPETSSSSVASRSASSSKPVVFSSSKTVSSTASASVSSRGSSVAQASSSLSSSPAVVGSGESRARANLEGKTPFGNFMLEGCWSLVNLIIAILTLLASLLFLGKGMINHFKKEQQAQEPQESQKPAAKRLRVAGILAGVLPMVAFLLLENTTLPMVWINRWTPLLLVLGLLQCILLVLGGKRQKDTEQEE